MENWWFLCTGFYCSSKQQYRFNFSATQFFITLFSDLIKLLFSIFFICQPSQILKIKPDLKSKFDGKNQNTLVNTNFSTGCCSFPILKKSFRNLNGHSNSTKIKAV